MKISLVIPAHNEAGNLEKLYREIVEALKKDIDYEIIVVDDGSSDDSVELLNKLAKKDERLKVVEFLRNSGQTAAMAAGIDLATGELVVTLDADRQNDPQDIPKMLQELDKDTDIISGWRKDRQDPFLRSFLSKFANKLINSITGTKIHDTGCSLKVYRKSCFEDIKLYGEMHRFIPALLLQQGYQVKEVKVNHRPRVEGESHYGFSRVIKVVLDLVAIKFLARFSTKPIHVFGLSGLWLLFFGGLSGVYVVYREIFLGGDWVSPMLFVTILLVIVGVQFILMGLIAEMITRANFESSDKKPYKIKNKVNF